MFNNFKTVYRAAHLVSLKKQIIRASIFIVLLILLGTTKTSAILQANATTHKSPVSKNGATWITEIRQMETSGQTMGLTETLNGLNATSASNGIDVHMMLPTEYGAVAILSASGYGNPKKLRDETNAQKRTTTGNSTGVYFTGDRWEWTAFLTVGTVPYYTNSVGLIGSIDQFMGGKGWHDGIMGDEQIINGLGNSVYVRSGFYYENNYLVVGGKRYF